jgi:hypothetical protein
MHYAQGRREMHSGLLKDNPKEETTRKTRLSREDNIKIYLKNRMGVKWILLAQDRN